MDLSNKPTPTLSPLETRREKHGNIERCPIDIDLLTVPIFEGQRGTASRIRSTRYSVYRNAHTPFTGFTRQTSLARRECKYDAHASKRLQNWVEAGLYTRLADPTQPVSNPTTLTFNRGRGGEIDHEHGCTVFVVGTTERGPRAWRAVLTSQEQKLASSSLHSRSHGSEIGAVGGTLQNSYSECKPRPTLVASHHETAPNRPSGWIYPHRSIRTDLSVPQRRRKENNDKGKNYDKSRGGHAVWTCLLKSQVQISCKNKNNCWYTYDTDGSTNFRETTSLYLDRSLPYETEAAKGVHTAYSSRKAG